MPTTRRQTKSATKIQATTRGRQTRRRLKNNKSSQKSSRKSSPKSSPKTSPKTSPRECPICLEEISKKDASKIMCSNKHLYHDKCIKEWMEHKTECPLCKENLLPDNKKKIVELLQTINMEEALNFANSVTMFLQKIQATANYNKKDISKTENNIILLTDEYIKYFGALDDLFTDEKEIDFLSRKKDGLKFLRKLVSLFKITKDKLRKQISKYPIDRLDERKIGIYNLELLEKPRRRIDAISRPAATERARVVRYTHSQ
jgi:hypothetical protein